MCGCVHAFIAMHFQAGPSQRHHHPFQTQKETRTERHLINIYICVCVCVCVCECTHMNRALLLIICKTSGKRCKNFVNMTVNKIKLKVIDK